MTKLPTPEQIDRAGDLDFTPKPASSIIIHARYGDWSVDIAFTGKLEQLPAYLERVSAAGLQPAASQAAPASPQRTKRETVEPFYKPDGTPCCPKHQKPLREGQFGLHCTSKDPTGRNGYCDLKFS